MDDMFALCAVRPYPCVRLSLCVCVRICVAVFECLSWHENSQARPCRMCDSAHTHTHISLSMAVVNMTVIRTTTQMLRMFAVLAKTCLAEATRGITGTYIY